MAPRRPDSETIAAIRAHWHARHQGELTEDQVALERKGRLPAATKVTVTPETARSPAWFTCGDCPEGARRYRVDVGADPGSPPLRHITAIRRHFREVHDVRQLPDAYIDRDASLPALVVYGPSTPLRGAHALCLLCPDGHNRILIEDPPYGDARSFRWLTMMHPELVRHVEGLDPVARAERFEAHHRGIIPQVSKPALKGAPNAARRGPPPSGPTELELGLSALIRAKAEAGMGITRAITELVALMERDPVDYACQLARVLPGMSAHRRLPKDRLAALTRVVYGRLERTERGLWAIWRRRSGDAPRLAGEDPG